MKKLCSKIITWKIFACFNMLTAMGSDQVDIAMLDKIYLHLMMGLATQICSFLYYFSPLSNIALYQQSDRLGPQRTSWAKLRTLLIILLHLKLCKKTTQFSIDYLLQYILGSIRIGVKLKRKMYSNIYAKQLQIIRNQFHFLSSLLHLYNTMNLCLSLYTIE